jgi:hypothetical protein
LLLELLEQNAPASAPRQVDARWIGRGRRAHVGVTQPGNDERTFE